jgi:hypothetical protein
MPYVMASTSDGLSSEKGFNGLQVPSSQVKINFLKIAEGTLILL